MHNNYAKVFKSLNYFYPKCKYELVYNKYISISALMGGMKSLYFL
jgi:hypothetical protein